MLHELFVTHYTNSTSIMNPFTLLYPVLKKICSFNSSGINAIYGTPSQVELEQ